MGSNEIENILENGYTFTNIKTNHTLTVEFAINTYTIYVSVTNGTTDPNGNKIVTYGEDISVTYYPDIGYELSSLVVDGIDIFNPDNNDTRYDFKDVSDDHRITVVFTKQKFLITANTTGDGTITPSSYVEYGEQQQFDFYPDTGYEIKNVLIDGVSIGAVEFYLFENVTQMHTITVEYQIKKFNI